MRRSIKILAGIVVLFLLLVIVSAAMSGNNSNTSTPTPTAVATAQATKSVAKATAKPTAEVTTAPTATPAATATPTPPSFMGLLVQNPASAGGDDQSGNINKEEQQSNTLDTSFHRATIDGRDVYVGVILSDSGQKLTYYMFPLGSFTEARAAQAAYVKQFEAKGFTKVSDDTSMSKEESTIQLQAPTGSGTMYIDALGFQADLGGPAMDIYYALSSMNTS